MTFKLILGISRGGYEKLAMKNHKCLRAMSLPSIKVILIQNNLDVLVIFCTYNLTQNIMLRKM